jgi:hypothetical protein
MDLILNLDRQALSDNLLMLGRIKEGAFFLNDAWDILTLAGHITGTWILSYAGNITGSWILS